MDFYYDGRLQYSSVNVCVYVTLFQHNLIKFNYCTRWHRSRYIERARMHNTPKPIQIQDKSCLMTFGIINRYISRSNLMIDKTDGTF